MKKKQQQEKNTRLTAKLTAIYFISKKVIWEKWEDLAHEISGLNCSIGGLIPHVHMSKCPLVRQQSQKYSKMQQLCYHFSASVCESW